MAKKKTGHVAIPFLIALLLGIVCIGGVAMYVFNHIGLDEVDIKEMQSSIKKPTEEDNMTLLFVLDEKENTSLPTTFLIARVLPGEKRLMLLSFPETMLAVVDGKQDTLTGFYHNNGIRAVESAIENEAGIATDRYIILDSEGFQKICDIFAGVDYVVPIHNVPGFEDSSKPQHLGPAQMEKLITYPFFDQGEVERNALTADIIAEMINQTDSERIVASMDLNFRTLINMMETDITSIDYSNEESALKYMYKYGNSIASFRIVTGEVSESGDVFLLDSNFYSSVSELFRNNGAVPAAAPADENDGDVQ